MKAGSRRVVGKHLCFDLRPAAKGQSRLGITASGRFGSSCERNRFKRLVREAFRLHPPVSFDIHVIPRQLAKGARLSDIASEFERLLHGPTQS